jgi:hypothetical protein
MNRLEWHSLFIVGLLILTLGGCSNDPPGATPPSSEAAPSLALTRTVFLTTDAEGGSARPEIAATTDRVFALYLGHISGDMTAKTFDVKVYNADLTSTTSSTTIVTYTTAYGGPTDIRIATDGQYCFTFFETTSTGTTFLHGEKHLLNDTFDLSARAQEPIAIGKPVFLLTEGGEILNDPAPLVGPDSVSVITRLWSSISTTGNTIYRVRELSKNDLSLIRQFDLDLSTVANGRARVTSLLYTNGSIYMALATTVSDTGSGDENKMSDDGAPSDILLIKMAPDWSFDPETDVRTLSAEPDDRENYITGLRTDGTRLFMTYKQALGTPPTGEQRAMIKIFDGDFNLTGTEIVRSVAWGSAGGSIRPSIELQGNKVFSAQDTGQGIGTGNGEVYLYVWK